LPGPTKPSAVRSGITLMEFALGLPSAGRAEEAQASTSAELRDHAARIITLEADKRAIKESLEEIKGSLKELTRKIDQLPR